MPTRVLSSVAKTAAVLALLAACGDGADRSRPDVTFGDTAQVVEVPLATPPEDARAVADRRWATALGAAFVLPALGADGAPPTLVPVAAPEPSPDTAGLGATLGATAPLELFARAGLVGRATLLAIAPGDTGTDAPAETWADSARLADGTQVCAAWPAATVRVDTAVAPDGWQLALPAARATGVPLDSLETMATRDSATFAAALTTLASRLPDDSTSAFRGLPFTVRQGYRAARPEGLVVGVLVRSVPQEDQPLEERTLLVVHVPTDSAAARDVRRWRVAWSERVRGSEETLVAADPVALLRLTDGDARVLALVRDDGVVRSLALLAESPATGSAPPSWRVRWERVVAGCR